MTGGMEDKGEAIAGAMPAEALAALLERFAEELAFLQPGSPEGLLPVNALLMDLEQVPGVAPGSAPAEALGIARRWVDGLLTNFHVPKSSLLMLVSAFAGVESVRAAYRVAVEQRYRFYSYGDAMLIV